MTLQESVDLLNAVQSRIVTASIDVRNAVRGTKIQDRVNAFILPVMADLIARNGNSKFNLTNAVDILSMEMRNAEADRKAVNDSIVSKTVRRISFLNYEKANAFVAMTMESIGADRDFTAGDKAYIYEQVKLADPRII